MRQTVLCCGLLLMVMGASSTGHGKEAEPHEDLAHAGFATGLLPCGVTMQENRFLSANYPGTDCFDLYRKSARNLGTVCISSNSDLLETMGVVTAYEAPSFGFSRKPFVVTGNNRYEMEHFFSVVEGTVMLATIDCDTTGGPVYRSTSTCFLATAPVSANKFLYAHFVSEFHTDAKPGISKACAKNILSDLLK